MSKHKAKTVGQKRRGRPRNEIAEREANGRTMRRAERDQREAAMLAQVEARSRAIGIWPAPITRAPGEPEEVWRARSEGRLMQIRAAARFVGLPWMGSPVGRSIAAEIDIVPLWGVVTTIRNRHAAKLRAIQAPGGSPGILGRIVSPDSLDSDVEVPRYDPRPEDERHVAAVDAWADVEDANEPRVIEAVLRDADVTPSVEPWLSAEIPHEVGDWLIRASTPQLIRLAEVIAPMVAERLKPRQALPLAPGLRRVAFRIERGRRPSDAAELNAWWSEFS